MASQNESLETPWWLQWRLMGVLQVAISTIFVMWKMLQRMIKGEAHDELRSDVASEKDDVMKPHTEEMMRNFEFASVIMAYRSARQNAGLEPPKLPSEVPLFLLLGVQSSGKTTLLQRLTRMDVGVTGSTQGTSRPFQFTLVHDPRQDGHLIEVDGENVAAENLLQKLSAKNAEKGGDFDPRRVSVTIRSKHVTSLIIVDMPGLSSVSNEPKNMALKELEDPSAIPILVLPCTDPRSADSAREAFEKLLDDRETPAVIIYNKFDEKIMEDASELGNLQKWSEWLRSWGSQSEDTRRRFSACFMVGVPPGNPNEDLVTRLKASHRKEERLIQQWKKRCGPDAMWPSTIKFGLASFEEFVHTQQSEKLLRFVDRVRPKLEELRKDEQDLLPQKKEDCRSLMKQLASVVTEGQKIWEGRLEPGLFPEGVKRTLEQELDWLKDQKMGDRALKILMVLETGQFPEEVVDAASGVSQENRGLRRWLVELVPHSETHLLGLNAPTRFADWIVRYAFVYLWKHTTRHYNLEFFRNSVSDQQNQSPNNAIKEYKKAMCARLFRPLAELMRIMLQDQFVRSMEAPFDSSQRDLKPWFQSLQTESVEVEALRDVYGKEVTDISTMTGDEFLVMMSSDIQTLETELLHSFSDDESANFVRQNHALGGPNCLEDEDSHKHQCPKEVLSRRFLRTFEQLEKRTRAPQLESLRHQAELALSSSTIASPVRAGGHEVAEFFSKVALDFPPHVISEPDCRCISSAPTFNKLFAGPKQSCRDDFRRLHLVSPPINSAECAEVVLDILGYTDFWVGQKVLPTNTQELGCKEFAYCGVVLQEKESERIIETCHASSTWTKVRITIPQYDEHGKPNKLYLIHILDFQCRGIACKGFVCRSRGCSDPSGEPLTKQTAPEERMQIEKFSGKGSALEKIMRSEVAIRTPSQRWNSQEEGMFHDLSNRIILEMCSTLKHFHNDLHKNLNKFREATYSRAPACMDGIRHFLDSIKEDRERAERLKMDQLYHRLMLIQKAKSIVETC